MPSTKFVKDPPVYDEGRRGDATSYLKNYSLFIRRILWGVEGRNPNMPERDMRRYISKLSDPLAFRSGYTETVEAVETILDGFNSGEIEEEFRIKTVVRQVGKYGGLITRKQDCVLWTVINLDHKPSGIETIHMPSSSKDDVNWTELKVTASKWIDQSDEILSDLQEGDELEIYMGPSDTGKFEVGFEASRSN